MNPVLLQAPVQELSVTAGRSRAVGEDAVPQAVAEVVESHEVVQGAEEVKVEMNVVRVARQHTQQEPGSIRKISGEGKYLFHKMYRTAYDLVKVEENYKDCLMQRSFF